MVLHPTFTLWRTSGLTKEATWSAFHKLQPVFKKRSRPWSTFLHSLPTWIAWLLWFAFIFLFPSVRFLLYKVMSHPKTDTIVLLSYGFVIIAIAVGKRGTYLILRHSWDPSPIPHYLKDKLIPVVTGALIGIGGTILGLYLRHRFWP